MDAIMLVGSLLLLVAAAAAIRFVISDGREYGFDGLKWVLIVGIVAFIFGLIGVIYHITALATTEETPREERIDTEYVEIVQLRDTTMDVSGTFFLGSGSVEGKPAYLYYIEENGDYWLQHVDAETIPIRYITDGSVPRIETTTYITGHYWRNYWTSEYVWSADKTSITIAIYVPEGSIKRYYLDSGDTSD